MGPNYVISFLLLMNLIESSLTECQTSFKSLELKDLSKMIYYSGRDLNDFGDQYACEKLEMTRFVVVLVKIEGLILGLGICGPEECRAKDYQNSIEWAENNFFSQYPAASKIISAASIDIVDIKEYNSRKFDGAAIASLVVITTLFIIISIGTVIDKLYMDEEVKGWRSVLICFSFTRNISKIFTYPSGSNKLQLFNGIKVMSMLFICYSHNYVTSFAAPSKNPTRAVSILQEFWSHLAIFPIYMVDVFFVISSFLLTYFLFPEIQKRKGKLNWFQFSIHRLLRICPIYYFMLMIFVNLFKYIGSGTLWPTLWPRYEYSCKYWWSNMLFISNFVPNDDYSCMGWSWFIANDMQFHFLAPIILLIHYRSKVFGYSLIIFLIFSCFLFGFIQSIVYEYNPGILYGTSNKDQFLNNYQKPYTRIGPYLIAMFFGLVYREYTDRVQNKEIGIIELSDLSNDQLIRKNDKLIRKNEDRIWKIEEFLISWVGNKRLRICAYLLGWTIMLGVPFMTYNFDNNGTEYWETGSKALFIASEHLIFAIGFMIWLTPLVEGHGGAFKYILESKYFSVIAKISFSFYLIHPMVILFSAYNRPDSHYISHFTYIYSFPATVFYSCCLALLATTCIESPILALEKLIFKKSR